MKTRFSFLFAVLSLIVGCRTPEIRRIPLHGQIAEGVFLPGNVLNGRVNFYDSATKQLVEFANYKNGILDGRREQLYSNGNTRLAVDYSMGKENGYVVVLDTLGNFETAQFRYFGLRVGPEIDYKKGNPSAYSFHSLDDDLLFHIDYDSVRDRKISEIQSNLFFFHTSSFEAMNYTDSGRVSNEYLIYLINPPKYNFQYSLCIVNDSLRILKELKKFDSHNVWDVFDVDTTDIGKNNHIALHLDIEDSLHEGFGIMTALKKIN